MKDVGCSSDPTCVSSSGSLHFFIQSWNELLIISDQMFSSHVLTLQVHSTLGKGMVVKGVE